MDNSLEKEFEKTGDGPAYHVVGFGAAPRVPYVNWLENKLLEARATYSVTSAAVLNETIQDWAGHHGIIVPPSVRKDLVERLNRQMSQMSQGYRMSFEWYKKYCGFCMSEDDESGIPDCACDSDGRFDTRNMTKCATENCTPLKGLKI